MPTDPQQLEQAGQYAVAIVELNVDDLVGRDRLGAAFAFNEAGLFNQAKRVCGQLARIDWVDLTTEYQTTLVATVSTTHEILQQIRGFQLQVNDPAGARQALITRLSAALTQLTSQASPILLLKRLEEGYPKEVRAAIDRAEKINVRAEVLAESVKSAVSTVDSLKKETASQLDKLETQYAEASDELKLHRVEQAKLLDEHRALLDASMASAKKDLVDVVQKSLNEIEAKYSDTHALASVAAYAADFQRASDDYKRKSQWWLISTASFAALGVGFFLYITGMDWPGENLFETWQFHLTRFVSIRVLVILVVTYGITWCSRNYRAHCHNAVVNGHRAKALSTFEGFAKGVTDNKEARNAILLQTSQLIFTAQPSGYLYSEPEAPPHSIITDALAKSAGSKGSS